LALALARGEPGTDRADVQALFLPKIGWAGALNHEFEHARRRSAHGGAHDSGPDVDGQVVEFEAAALNAFNRAVREGFLDDWTASVRALVGMDAAALEPLVDAYRALEAQGAGAQLCDL